jgi:hypothetical protein
MLQEHLASLPEKTRQNIEHTNWMVQNSNPYDYTGGKNPHFSYDPRAAEEFANFMPNMMGGTNAAKEKMLKEISFNIGRNVGKDVNKLTNKEIEAAIKKNFPGSSITAHDVIEAQAGKNFGPFEPTSRVTIKASPENLKSQTHALSEALKQDAIPAFTHGGEEAVLAGPNAAAWGDEFNKNYFVHPGEESAFGNQYAKEVPFYHFSKQQGITSLDPSKYGTGMKGAEAGRLAEAEDIRPRSYYYLDKGEQTAKPESGVGGVRYGGVAKGVYDLATDPLEFFAATKQSAKDPYLASKGIDQYNRDMHMNAVERAIKKAGFKGYHSGDSGISFEPIEVAPKAKGGSVESIKAELKKIRKILKKSKK